MKRSSVNHDNYQHPHRDHVQMPEIMSKSLPPARIIFPTYLNASTGAAISSINGSLVIHVKSELQNTVISINNNISSNTSTPSYEQLSKEFYASYDPNIGFNTAAVLGGFLVWLVLYLIYKTKIRKCLIHLIKKACGDEDVSESKPSDSEKDSSIENNQSFVRHQGNPSIVIESSPSQSLPQSSLEYDQYHQHKQGSQDCLSSFSFPRAGNEILQVFNLNHAGSHPNLGQCHLDGCPNQHEFLLQLPKSEIDVPSATARWVQKMPLAARSRQDFAGLMMSMKSHGLLAMHKPCSCPLVCPTTPQPLPLLELPNTWNNSLPVLSSSLSSQILSAYEAVSNQHIDKDIKDIINAKKKSAKYSNSEYTSLIEKNLENFDYYRRHSHHIGADYSGHNRRASSWIKPNGRRRHQDGKENAPLVMKSTFSQSQNSIPVTPTVTIQSAKHLRPYNGRGSYMSISTSSSMDMLALPRNPHIHISKPVSSPHIPSPHLLSPLYDNSGRKGSHHFRWSYRDIPRCHDNRSMHRSESMSPRLLEENHHKCSFKYHKKDTPGDSNPALSNKSCCFSSQRSLHEKNLNRKLSHCHSRHSQIGLLYQCQSLTDFHYRSRLLLNSHLPLQHSQSAEIYQLMNLHRDQLSPAYSSESNKNSLATSSRSHTPSPHLLQVPDPSNLFRPLTPESGVNKHYLDVSRTGSQPSMRHCIRSDGNIAYSLGHCGPVTDQVDNSNIRRHSTFTSGPGEINLLFCGDNSVRPSSSQGSSGTPNHLHNHHSEKRSQQHHHSTGMLGVENFKNKRCGLYSQSDLNRSYSAVMMETNL